jgi:hypothetical protein
MSYDAPTPAGLKAAFPAFSAIDDGVIQFWLNRAARGVDESWAEDDFDFAQMVLAAHLMAQQGIGGSSQFSGLPEGVTNIRSGSFSMSVSDEAAKAQVAGGYGSTSYGRQYLELARQNRGGARITGESIGGDGSQWLDSEAWIDNAAWVD